jgi:hypothetical protein
VDAETCTASMAEADMIFGAAAPTVTMAASMRT